MGYKLAGFDVVGGVEIDAQMADLYQRNMRPRRLFRTPVGELAGDDVELPGELFSLDILDGSPPCSTFSFSGARDKKWGQKRKFREGQVEQVLDSLFMDYLKLVAKLRPKVSIAENVKGMVSGLAKGFAVEVLERYREIGYEPQLFVLNSARMGVPQSRERAFFIARRRDLKADPINLSFREPVITAEEAIADLPPQTDERPLSKTARNLWHMTRVGRGFNDAAGPNSWFNWRRSAPNLPFPTIPAFEAGLILHWSECRRLTKREVVRAQTFPEDYDFGDVRPFYVCGMSVPPLMMQRIAIAVRDKWWNGAA